MAQVFINDRGLYLTYINEIACVNHKQFIKNRLNSIVQIKITVENGVYIHSNPNALDRLKKSIEDDYKNTQLILTNFKK
jgi:hypothetical protein